MSGDAATRPDIPVLPPEARKAAEAAYRNWRIGADGEGRLHAALLAYAAAEGERTVRLEAALRRHMPVLDERGTPLCGGCLEPAPCPDAGLIAEEPSP